MGRIKSLLFLFFVLIPGFAFAGDAREAYAKKDFRAVPAAALRDLSNGSLDQVAIGTILSMAAESLAVEPEVKLSEYLAVLDAAKPRFESRRLDAALDLEKKALLKWIPREEKLEPDAVEGAISWAEKMPQLSRDDVRKRSTELLALSVVARRKLTPRAGIEFNPEWLFIAARALVANDNGGETFLERYLTFPDKKRLKHVKEARALLKKLNEDQG